MMRRTFPTGPKKDSKGRKKLKGDFPIRFVRLVSLAEFLFAALVKPGPGECGRSRKWKNPCTCFCGGSVGKRAINLTTYPPACPRPFVRARSFHTCSVHRSYPSKRARGAIMIHYNHIGKQTSKTGPPPPRESGQEFQELVGLARRGFWPLSVGRLCKHARLLW